MSGKEVEEGKRKDGVDLAEKLKTNLLDFFKNNKDKSDFVEFAKIPSPTGEGDDIPTIVFKLPEGSSVDSLSDEEAEELKTLLDEFNGTVKRVIVTTDVPGSLHVESSFFPASSKYDVCILSRRVRLGEKAVDPAANLDIVFFELEANQNSLAPLSEGQKPGSLHLSSSQEEALTYFGQGIAAINGYDVSYPSKEANQEYIKLFLDLNRPKILEEVDKRVKAYEESNKTSGKSQQKSNDKSAFLDTYGKDYVQIVGKNVPLEVSDDVIVGISDFLFRVSVQTTGYGLGGPTEYFANKRTVKIFQEILDGKSIPENKKKELVAKAKECIQGLREAIKPDGIVDKEKCKKVFFDFSKSANKILGDPSFAEKVFCTFLYLIFSVLNVFQKRDFDKKYGTDNLIQSFQKSFATLYKHPDSSDQKASGTSNSTETPSRPPDLSTKGGKPSASDAPSVVPPTGERVPADDTKKELDPSSIVAPMPPPKSPGTTPKFTPDVPVSG